MLFLFRGHHGPAIRAICGALLLAVGIALPGGAILVGIGAVLIVWGGVGVVSAWRAGHPSHLSNRGGRMS